MMQKCCREKLIREARRFKKTYNEETGRTMKKGKHFKHLTLNDRQTIERMLLNGFSKKEISMAVGCSVRTVYYEIKRATYIHTNSDLTEEERYNPEAAEEAYRAHLKAKGRKPLLTQAKKLVDYISSLIIEQKYSPEACIMELHSQANLSFEADIKSVNTIYEGIRRGYFKDVTMKVLPRRGMKKQKKKKVLVQKRPSRGTSIEKRPEIVDTRDTFGHWEMDCVVGKSTNKKTILVLTERKTRQEILEVLKDKTMNEVVKALNRIEKRLGGSFYKIFRTITVDNGSEFSDYIGMEKSLHRIGKRVKVYYCHPRAPHERGSNENNNHLVRRWYPKGSDFDKILKRPGLKEVEWWINTYPRKKFKGKTSKEIFDQELNDAGICPDTYC